MTSPIQSSSEVERDIYRQELGTLILDLREFTERLKRGEFFELSRVELAEVLETIING
jgi:hypothetical protein